LLGFKNFAEYSLKLCMAAKPENVEKFLNQLASKLQILLAKENEILLNYKKEEVLFLFE
jgi:Zn-dependent oligopeptidase